MNKKSTLLLMLSFMLLIPFGCEDDDADDHDHDHDGGSATITTPANYVFNSRFTDGESSVYYNGQIVRQLLINDIKTQAGTDAGSGSAATLLSMMANDDANRTILTTTTPSSMQTTYQSISSSHLNDRLTAVSSYTLTGYGMNAGDQISAWVTDLVTNGKTNADGLRLDQMIQKTLWGAVSYWQGTSKYMSKIPADDNTVAAGDNPWTEMEHHWDESFGYFGAARDYNTGYTDDNDRKSTPYFDSNSDGSIDFTTEYNLGWAVTAAKRDLVSNVTVDYDFTKTIMDAYLEGRTLIHNQAPIEQILAQRDIILNTWEKVVAAVTIHYINDVNADMMALYPADSTAGPLSDASADYNNHWAEMRAYAHCLLYNDFKTITDANLQTVLEAMGTKPVYPADGYGAYYGYHGGLVGTAKSILKSTYGFSDEHMENW